MKEHPMNIKLRTKATLLELNSSDEKQNIINVISVIINEFTKIPINGIGSNEAIMAA
jgi:hypothetical protein